MVRTFFAIALQLARALPSLDDLIAGGYEGDRARVRRAARELADAILDGARGRGSGPFVRTRIDQQRRTESLHHTRPRRPGRTSQALVARRHGATAPR